MYVYIYIYVISAGPLGDGAYAFFVFSFEKSSYRNVLAYLNIDLHVIITCSLTCLLASCSIVHI